MGTTFNRKDMKEIIVEELAKHTELSTNKLFEKLIEHGFNSRKTMIKNLNIMEEEGFIIRNKNKGKGFKRFIQLKPVLRDKEKDIKKFEKALENTLELVKYKVKNDKTWDPVNEPINMILKRIWLSYMSYKLSEPIAVRRYVFLKHFELMDKFFDKLSKLLYKLGYFNREETIKQLIELEKRNSDFLSK